MKRLQTIIRDDPDLMRLLEFLREAGLPQWRVVSGCLYQTVWNTLCDLPRGTGIQDIDVIYFDAGDLSWEAEDAAIRRMMSDISRSIRADDASPPSGRGRNLRFVDMLQIRNQARVHLWYERHFGAPYAPLRSADESLLRYPATVQAIGARLEPDGRLDIVAPFGVEDVFAMVMRPNPNCPDQATFAAKAERARAMWPRIRVA